MTQESAARDPLDESGHSEVDAAADARMADMLRGSTSGAELRRELVSDDTEQASDLLARLDALDFVQQVVGGSSDVPTRLGDYTIKGLLGRGGMGTVYLGWQEELEREVALKVLSPHFSSDSTMRKRFRAEARATAALHHRHIVPIYDYGESQGMLYFAMERVDGMSLDKHIAAARRSSRLPMDPLEASRRFAGVADALGLAHRRRLLHRDVKPGNILVGSDGTLALTDFGLAKALDQASARLTSKGGGFLGTLHYASPEQALGRELTPASDLYSLGVTLFEAVTGELPLHGKTTEALLQSILHGTPKRLREFLPKPPRDLDVVLEKLLSREPGDRYQDGEALARDLQRIADGEPIHIRRLPLHVRLWRRARKNPVLAGAIAATVVLLLVTVLLLSVLRRETGKSFVMRHQQSLDTIAKTIENEVGAPWGPQPLLVALTGVEHPVVPPSSQVLGALDRAHKEIPDDAQVEKLRVAYVEDPLPAASSLLREGRAFEALRMFDLAIFDAIAARTSGEHAVELRLFHLYIGRAVANLSAAVGRLTDARTDLALASWLRPGAVFPRTLLDVIEVADNPDVEKSVQRLERDLAQASPERLRVVGLLLWTVAGLQPPQQANMMDFALGYAKRRRLHDFAQRLLGAVPGDLVACGQPTGLSARFSAAAKDVLDRRNDPNAQRTLAVAAEAEILRCVHPDSPLQGWRSVLQLIRDPQQKGNLVDAEQRPLSSMLQLAAWEDLLRLPLPREMMPLWLPRFEELRKKEPNLPGMRRVAASVHYLAGSPEAETLIMDWLTEAEGDPAAQLCRMAYRLHAGELERALDDGMVAVQQSVAPEETLREVVRLCEDAAALADQGTRQGVLAMAQSFRWLHLDGGGPRPEVR
ncbi:MAG: serine/threonine protein kinase [Planctomycetes bacterium]|nr:serine/threonine protein kinase [Planctomycetota bacterium]